MPPTENDPAERDTLTDIDAAIAGAIDAAIDEGALLADLAGLIAEPSLGGRETACQEKMADLMGLAGLNVDLWELDFETLRRHPAYSAEVERDRGLGVVGTWEGAGDGPSLILNGHVDVVPIGDENQWTVPPFQATVTEDRVYGRGSCDMKGGLCCALAAIRALRKVGVRLRGRLILQSVIGEEDGGCGTLAAVQHGCAADGAVIMEPTGLGIVAAQAGAMNFRLRIPGRAAHACVRDEGISAIERFWPIHQALLEHEQEKNAAADHPLFADQRPPWPLSIGTLKAGDWPSSVPDELVAEGRYGVSMDEGLGLARERFEAVVSEAAARDTWLREHPPTVEWWGGQFEPAETPADAPIVQTLQQAFKTVTGTDPVLTGVPYGADMRLLIRQGGIPTVMFGPGDVRQAHAPDEFVPRADLLTVTQTLARGIVRFCGTV